MASRAFVGLWSSCNAHASASSKFFQPELVEQGLRHGKPVFRRPSMIADRPERAAEHVLGAFARLVLAEGSLKRLFCFYRAQGHSRYATQTDSHASIRPQRNSRGNRADVI